jgi:hypothetical protein
MWKITIKGEARTDYPDLEKLDGIDCQDDFAEYSDFNKDLEGGYMFFKYEKEKLMTYTQYTAKKEFNEEQLQQLAEETQGQWSDGIGEGFEQSPCLYVEEYKNSDGEYTDEVYISPWFSGQKIEIKQEQIEKQLN